MGKKLVLPRRSAISQLKGGGKKGFDWSVMYKRLGKAGDVGENG